VSGLGPIVREVISACDSLTTPTEVGYFGTPGSFAHLAARQHFGHAAHFVALATTAEVLERVARGRLQFGLLPLETSSDGAVTATLTGLSQSEACICAEVEVEHSYHLLSTTGNSTDIEKVYGTRAALAASQAFLARELPRATLMDVPSGELAAELARSDHGAGVVGTRMLEELFSLRVAVEAISPRTSTRYAVVSTELPSRSGKDRTVITMAVHDAPGALYESLKPFASRDVNLTNVESRPTEQWRYLFFVEMEGHVTDRPILTALEELRSISRFVKVLGSYPL
jgi:chorismate mutase/prephenate dehydratase